MFVRVRVRSTLRCRRVMLTRGIVCLNPRHLQMQVPVQARTQARA